MSTELSTLDILFTELSYQGMNSNSEISWEEVKTLVDEIKFEVHGKYLTDIETKALQGAYEKKIR